MVKKQKLYSEIESMKEKIVKKKILLKLTENKIINVLYNNKNILENFKLIVSTSDMLANYNVQDLR